MPHEEEKSSDYSLPFPVLVTNDEGAILSANTAFQTLAGGIPPVGANVTDFFTPGEIEAIVAGRKHALFQKAQDGQFHFILVDNPPSAKISATPEKRFDLELFDPKNGLYSKQYSQIRLTEELSRANRYRRWLCGILLKMNYTYLPGLGHRPELEESFFVAYVQYVKDVIRESDMAFFLGGSEILLLLPETPQQGAKDTSLKLIDLPEPLLEMKKDFPFSVDVEYGFLYYSGNYPMQPGQFIEKLYSSLGGATE